MQFHRTEGGTPSLDFRVGTWNVGGLSAQHALDLARDFAGHPELSLMHVLLLQEIVTEPGVAFHEEHGWVIVYGKNEGDWRGTAVAYRSAGRRHTNTKLLPGGLATSITNTKGAKGTRFLSGHIPHHATIAQRRRRSSQHGGPPWPRRGWCWVSTPTNASQTKTEKGGAPIAAGGKQSWKGWPNMECSTLPKTYTSRATTPTTLPCEHAGLTM